MQFTPAVQPSTQASSCLSPGKGNGTSAHVTLQANAFLSGDSLQLRLKVKPMLECAVTTCWPLAGGRGADSSPCCTLLQGLIELWQLRDISGAAPNIPKISPSAG